MTRSSLSSLLSIILFVTFLSGISGCNNDSPIKIGFSGGLTGRHSDLGLYGRDGALLAIEEANLGGGINGRPLELIIKDDKQDAATAIKVDQQLIDEGVVAIIGHFTSAMSVAAVPLINDAKVLMISPTSSTNLLTGQDDYFLRLMSPNIHANEKLASHIYDTLNLLNIIILYDDQNQPFALDWVKYFTETGVKKMRNVTTIPFHSEPSFQFSSVATDINAHAPDGLLIIASALDASMICQQIRKTGAGYPIFTTMWSMSDEFLQHGGKAINGVTFANWFDPDYPGEASRRFQHNYRERFGKAPNFSSHFAYESTSILINGLRITDDPTHLKESILQQQKFEGTQGTILIDKYGDPMRELFLMTVKDGKFVRVE